MHISAVILTFIGTLEEQMFSLCEWAFSVV